MTEFLAFVVPDLFSLKKNDYFYNRDYKLIQTEVQNFTSDVEKSTGKIMRPNVPIHMGYHICDDATTENLKKQLTSILRQADIKALEDLRDNPILSSTHLVSQSLSILRSWEFR